MALSDAIKIAPRRLCARSSARAHTKLLQQHCARKELAACCARLRNSVPLVTGCSPVKSEWGTRSFIRFSSEGGSKRRRRLAGALALALAPSSLVRREMQRGAVADAALRGDWICNLSRPLIRDISLDRKQALPQKTESNESKRPRSADSLDTWSVEYRRNGSLRNRYRNCFIESLSAHDPTCVDGRRILSSVTRE